MLTPLITTVAGGGLGDGGPAAAATLYRPSSVSIDATGNLLIADTYDNRVREVSNATGGISTVAGGGASFVYSSPAVGAFGFAYQRRSRLRGDLFIADGSLVVEFAANGANVWTYTDNSDNSEDDTWGLGKDSAGDIFIAEAFTNCVREVNHATHAVTTVAGGGTGGLGDGGAATAATLGQPEGVAVDAAGNLYIADTWDNRIREVNHTTGVITTVAGDGAQSYGGDGGLATSAAACRQASRWMRLATSSSPIRGITEFARLTTRPVSLPPLPETASRASAAMADSRNRQSLMAPRGWRVDSAGNILIADTNNDRIQEVNQTTGVIVTLAGGGSIGDGGQGNAASIHYPQGVAVDSLGDVFLSDTAHNRIREVNAASGVISTVAGTGTPGYSGNGGNATAARLNSPAGIALDASGNLYIADCGNNCVREVSAATGLISTVAGTGVAGYSGDGHRRNQRQAQLAGRCCGGFAGRSVHRGYVELPHPRSEPCNRDDNNSRRERD